MTTAKRPNADTSEEVSSSKRQKISAGQEPGAEVELQPPQVLTPRCFDLHTHVVMLS